MMVKNVPDLVLYRESAQSQGVQVPTEMKAGRNLVIAGRGALSGISCFWVPGNVAKLTLNVGGCPVARYIADDARGGE